MNTRQPKALLCGTLLATWIPVQGVQAQGFAIDWFTMDGGGGISTGGAYSLSGTIGQPDAGSLTAASFKVEGGFWAAAAIQTPGAPWLTITRAGAGVVVSWPRPATGFLLDSTTSLNPPVAWSQVSFPYHTNATDISVTVMAPIGNQFYRLRKP